MADFAAVSGHWSDIQDAVDLAAAAGVGNNATIPAGTHDFVDVDETWAAHIGVTVPAGTNVIGAGELGAGFDETDQVANWLTVLELPWDMPSDIGGHEKWFYVDGDEDPAKPTRISGFAMVGYRYTDNEATNMYEGVRAESVIDLRVDHLLLRDIAGNGLILFNEKLDDVLGRGVIDHCKLINSAGIPAPYDERTVGYGVYPRLSWSSSFWDDDRVNLIGMYDRTLFVEDCYFQRWRHCIGSNQGAHYVFRYNTIKHDWGYGSGGCVDAHGQENVANTATMVVEIYNNTITDIIMPRVYTQVGIGTRGGCGVIWNNTIDSPYYGIYLSYEAIVDKYAIHDLYLWDNTITGTSVPFATAGPLVEDHNYFLRAPNMEDDGFVYNPYTYPHPLVYEDPPPPPPNPPLPVLFAFRRMRE